MKKIFASVVFAIIALVVPMTSMAVNPLLKQVEDAMNSQCPMDMGDGNVVNSLKFTDDSMVMDMTVDMLDGMESSDLTPEFRKEFHDGVISGMAGGAEFKSLCEMFNLKYLEVIVRNPSGREILREKISREEL